MMPRGHIVSPLIERVMSRVEPVTESGCWIFTGAVNDNGYGIVGRGGRGAGNERAHRVTYQHFVGPIPDGMFVCHRCDVPSCCNPDHLFLGTNTDNMRDCFSKGRGSKPPANDHIKGSAHVNAKLDEEQVRQMRLFWSMGDTLAQLAESFGVSDSTVYRIVTRQRWKHVA